MHKKIPINKNQNNKNLHKASKIKNDEFYTQYKDIEKEIIHYKDFFKNKIVYCNCDNPEWSNFWKYFKQNFRSLKLKKLISTHLQENTNSYKLEIIKNMNNELEIKKTQLKGNGSFNSIECIEILKETDIIVSNPPFSLFKEYIKLLIDNHKHFLVIGNNSAITYKEIFKQIKENKLWLGVSPRSMNFILPNGDLKSVNANWYTNIIHNKRNNFLNLTKTYKKNKNHYYNFDGFNAINIDKVKDIPIDYKGVMGVPITFMDKYNPNQFEILGAEKFYEIETSKGIFETPTHKLKEIDRTVFKRIWIKLKKVF